MVEEGIRDWYHLTSVIFGRQAKMSYYSRWNYENCLFKLKIVPFSIVQTKQTRCWRMDVIIWGRFKITITSRKSVQNQMLETRVCLNTTSWRRSSLKSKQWYINLGINWRRLLYLESERIHKIWSVIFNSRLGRQLWRQWISMSIRIELTMSELNIFIGNKSKRENPEGVFLKPFQ